MISNCKSKWQWVMRMTHVNQNGLYQEAQKWTSPGRVYIVEKKLWFTFGRLSTGAISMENYRDTASDSKYITTKWPCNSTFLASTRRTLKHSKRYMHTYVHCNATVAKIETNPISNDKKWIKKFWTIYNEILYRHKKRWSLTIYYIIDGLKVG